MANHVSSQTTPTFSHSGTSRHLFSSASDVHIDSPFISNAILDKEGSTPLEDSTHNAEGSWGTDSIQNFLNYSDDDQNGHINLIENSSGVKRNYWQWADQLISVDEVLLDSNWSDILADVEVLKAFPDALIQQPQSGYVSVDNNNQSSASNQSKIRMLWTPELHEAFVAVVTQLGGATVS